MITSAQCKTYLDECHVLGTDPDISVQRATSVMSICRTLIELGARLAHRTWMHFARRAYRLRGPIAAGGHRAMGRPRRPADAFCRAGLTRFRPGAAAARGRSFDNRDLRRHKGGKALISAVHG